MDMPSTAWLSNLEAEEPEFMNQYQMRNPCGSLDSFSSESFTDYPPLVTKNQPFQAANNCAYGDLATQSTSNKPDNNSSTPINLPANTFTISFGKPDSRLEINPHQLIDGDLEYLNTLKQEEMSPKEFLGFMEVPRRVPSTNRNSIQAQDHVLAERKRREKLTQRFISLSALLPDLKKMDKASVLEDATNYIKQLQTRVKELEEKAQEKDTIQESGVYISRSKLSGAVGDDDASSSDDANSSPINGAYKFSPEIEVRISGSSVLVRIYCQSDSSLVMKALNEMERLHLTIICSSVIPFAHTDLLITVTAQMSDEFPMAATDLVRSLQSAVRNLL